MTRPGRPAADRLAVEATNARTEHQRSEQLWAPVSMNLGPQDCGAAPRTLPTTLREDYYNFPMGPDFEQEGHPFREGSSALMDAGDHRCPWSARSLIIVVVALDAGGCVTPV
jgi:hypothetical protein